MAEVELVLKDEHGQDFYGENVVWYLPQKPVGFQLPPLLFVNQQGRRSQHFLLRPDIGHNVYVEIATPIEVC